MNRSPKAQKPYLTAVTDWLNRHIYTGCNHQHRHQNPRQWSLGTSDGAYLLCDSWLRSWWILWKSTVIECLKKGLHHTALLHPNKPVFLPHISMQKIGVLNLLRLYILTGLCTLYKCTHSLDIGTRHVQCTLWEEFTRPVSAADTHGIRLCVSFQWTLHWPIASSLFPQLLQLPDQFQPQIHTAYHRPSVTFWCTLLDPLASSLNP